MKEQWMQICSEWGHEQRQVGEWVRRGDCCICLGQLVAVDGLPGMMH